MLDLICFSCTNLIISQDYPRVVYLSILPCNTLQLLKLKQLPPLHPISIFYYVLYLD